MFSKFKRSEKDIYIISTPIIPQINLGITSIIKAGDKNVKS